jgi:phage shock protein C
MKTPICVRRTNMETKIVTLCYYFYMAAVKRLYKSGENKMLTGLLGGLGEYFAVDATILRLLFILVTIFTGVFPGIFIYLLAVLVVPRK